MSEKKKKQPTPQEPVEEKTVPVKEEAPAAEPQSAAETFTVTKEQMQQFEELAKLLTEENDKYLRLCAEYDNYRKRTAREKEGIYSDAKADTIRPFLEVYDNLRRAADGLAEQDPHKQGFEMIVKQFLAVLEKQGVTPIDAAGQPFDPQRHNAVMHVEDENLAENTVAEVFQEGFIMGDKVLRFAMVKVAN